MSESTSFEPGALMSAGHASIGAGKFGEAADHFEAACAAYGRQGDENAARYASVRRAMSFLEMGEPGRAEALLAKTGPQAERADDTVAFLGALLGLAEVSLLRRDFARARHVVDLASEQAANRGAGPSFWRATLLRLEGLLASGDLLGFDAEFEAVQPPDGGGLQELDIAHYSGLQAVHRVSRGNLGVGTTEGVEAVRRLTDAGRPSVAVRLLGYLSDRFQGAGEVEIAIQFADQAAMIALAVGNLPAALRDLQRTSRLLVQSDRPAEAIEVLERAIGAAQRAGWLVEIEALLSSALSIERALDYPRLVMHRLMRLAEVSDALHGPVKRQAYLIEALTVGVAAHVPGVNPIAEDVVAQLSEATLDAMDDKKLLGFAKNLGQAGQFEAAHGFVMARAQRYVSEERSRRAAELAAELAEIALSVGRSDVAESGYAMAIVIGERLGILETESWRDRLDFILYG